MVFATRSRLAVSVAIAAISILAGLIAPAQGQGNSATQRYRDERLTDVRMQFDNDMFAGSEEDRDYTGSLGVTLSGTAARDTFLSLDPLLATIDQVAQLGSSASSIHERRSGMVEHPRDRRARSVVGRATPRGVSLPS